MTNFETFKTERLFENVMSKSGSLDGYHNYIGHDFTGYLCGPIKTRDSDILDRANFEAALERLGEPDDESLIVRSVNHWACGYFDQIMVKADSPLAEKLFNIYEDLKDYPILNEDVHSRFEYDTYSEYADLYKDDVAKDLAYWFDIPEDCLNDEKLLDLACQLGLEWQFQYGEDSAFQLSENADDQDFERLIRCLRDVPKLDDNEYYDYLISCLGLD